MFCNLLNATVASITIYWHASGDEMLLVNKPHNVITKSKTGLDTQKFNNAKKNVNVNNNQSFFSRFQPRIRFDIYNNHSFRL